MDSFTGEIRIFGFNYAPMDWAMCNGARLPVSQYQALYAVIGNRFGGDPVQFQLPDLQGRAVRGAYPDGQPGPHLADTAGAEKVALTSASLPSHTHPMNSKAPENLTDKSAQPANNLISRLSQQTVAYKAYTTYDSQKPATALNPTAISVVGQGAAHENRQPYLALNFCISLNGEFPPHP